MHFRDSFGQFLRAFIHNVSCPLALLAGKQAFTGLWALVGAMLEEIMEQHSLSKEEALEVLRVLKSQDLAAMNHSKT